MPSRLFACCLPVFLLYVSHLQASSITFNTLPANTENGTYNGFVGATIDGAATNVICDDFVHTTYVPSGPTAFYQSSFSDLTDARFSAAVYRREALLLFGDGTNSLPGILNDPGNVASYQYAIWGVAEPDSTGSYGSSAALVTTVQSDNFSNPAFADLYNRLQIYTPMAGGDQEFLAVANAPEPASSGLMGFGLLGLTPLGRKYGLKLGAKRLRWTGLPFHPAVRHAG